MFCRTGLMMVVSCKVNRIASIFQTSVDCLPGDNEEIGRALPFLFNSYLLGGS